MQQDHAKLPEGRSARPPVFKYKGLWPRIFDGGKREVSGAVSRLKEQRHLNPTLRRVRPYSMLSDGRLVQLARDVQDVLNARIPGCFVECGVWRGGASFLMADLLRRQRVTDRRVWLFDSFEGLPPVGPLDGISAADFRQSGRYFDNNSASLEEVQAGAEELGLSEYVTLVKGWFENTVLSQRDDLGPIALLRIDGDWYESVKECLEGFYDQVSPDGYIILDDYFDWQGCALAVHEFLWSRRLPHRIVTQRTGDTVVIRKHLE
jgi:O-methyltransferase